MNMSIKMRTNIYMIINMNMYININEYVYEYEWMCEYERISILNSLWVWVYGRKVEKAVTVRNKTNEEEPTSYNETKKCYSALG